VWLSSSIVGNSMNKLVIVSRLWRPAVRSKYQSAWWSEQRVQLWWHYVFLIPYQKWTTAEKHSTFIGWCWLCFSHLSLDISGMSPVLNDCNFEPVNIIGMQNSILGNSDWLMGDMFARCTFVFVRVHVCLCVELQGSREIVKWRQTVFCSAASSMHGKTLKHCVSLNAPTRPLSCLSESSYNRTV